MDIFAQMERFAPENERETTDQALILRYARAHPDTVLTRQDEIAHITCSGFILNPSLSRMLLVHHHILGKWAWTGGHADGETGFLAVALREACEETGVQHPQPLTGEIASMDVLTVESHIKRGRYVSSHLHLNIAYLLLCDEREELHAKPDENAGVQWFDTEALSGPLFNAADRALYGRLVMKARRG